MGAITSRGNPKLGRRVPNFSTIMGLPSEGGTCPGASDWCRANCYAKRPARQYTNVRARWTENADAVRAGMMPVIPANATVYRVHVSGDFYDAAYVHAWRFLAESRPEVKFWAYTRSWRVHGLRKALEKLRALPNFELFASTDLSITEATPDGWRVAYIDDDGRYTGYECPEQNGRKADCDACGYCFRGRRGNVRFTTH